MYMTPARLRPWPRALADASGSLAIPHGHYIDCYPNEIGREAARDRLGLPADAFVYLALGLMRPYKGLEELAPAFRSLPDRDVVLLLAGKPSPASYAETLARLTVGDPRIRLIPQFVPPQDVQLYLNAADICVLPYRQITTSGAALLAFSFGAPVLAPRIGAFPHLLAEGRGILYDPADPAGLAHALTDAASTDWQPIRPEILAWVRQFDWPGIGSRLVAAYRDSCLLIPRPHARNANARPSSPLITSSSVRPPVVADTSITFTASA